MINFSVIICCFNSEKYICETIESVINQTYDNWELIIVNDGSNDNTKEIVKPYLHENKNIKYYEQKNFGFASARNLAISKCKNDWIVVIDHDDICLKNRLEIHKEQILTDKNNSKLFFGNTIHFYQDNSLKDYLFFDHFDMSKVCLKKKFVFDSLIKYGCFIDSESLMFERKIAPKFNTTYLYLADYVFFLDMAQICNFSYTKKVLSKWRIHDKQSTQLLKKTQIIEYFKLYFKIFFSLNFNFKLKIFIAYKILKLSIKSILR